MNRIILFLLPVSLMLTSCGDDGYEYKEPEHDLKVISSDFLFPPSGGEGTIVLETEAADITAKSSLSWCTPSVSGSSVRLTVAPYGGLEARYSTVTIFSGIDSVRVTIEQTGVLIEMESGLSYTVDDAATSREVPVTTNVDDVTFSTRTTWLSAKWTGESIILNVAENDSGHIREGYLIYSIGDVRDSIYVAQGEAKDLAGEYVLSGSGTYASGDVHVTVSADDDTTLTAMLQDLSLSFNIIFSQEDLSLKVWNRQYMGTYSDGSATRYAYWCMMDASSSPIYVYTDPAASMDGIPAYDEETGVKSLSFENNGSWSSHTADGWAIIGYSAQKDGEPSGTKKYPYKWSEAYMQTSGSVEPQR